MKLARLSTIGAIIILLTVVLSTNVFATRSICIEDADIELSQYSFDYTGSPIQPDVSVSYHDIDMAEGNNFDIYYFNNVEVGRGYVLVTGKNLFNGYQWIGFDINVSGLSIAQYASSDKFLGLPYIYGGTTMNGFDCSGFVQYVYAHFGYNLDRTASSQAIQGIAIQKENLLPGDLVFFSGNEHVGIYIGDNMFVHSSNRGIVITSLGCDEVVGDYYSSRYCGARRIIS